MWLSDSSGLERWSVADGWPTCTRDSCGNLSAAEIAHNQPLLIFLHKSALHGDRHSHNRDSSEDIRSEWRMMGVLSGQGKWSVVMKK